MRLCRILLALRVCVRNHTSCDDHPLSKQGFQQRPLLCMLFGIIGLELSQVQELPLNGWEAFGVRKADQTEIRLGVVKRKQKRCGIAREPGPDIIKQTHPCSFELDRKSTRLNSSH